MIVILFIFQVCGCLVRLYLGQVRSTAMLSGKCKVKGDLGLPYGALLANGTRSLHSVVFINLNKF